MRRVSKVIACVLQTRFLVVYSLALLCSSSQSGELWRHVEGSDGVGSTGAVASFNRHKSRGYLAIKPSANQSHSSVWAMIPGPKGLWDLSRKASVQAEVKNTGEGPVDVLLWAVSSHGWDAVGGKVRLEPGESQTVSCDLRGTYPDKTPKIDPNRIKEICIMLQRFDRKRFNQVEVKELVATGEAEPWEYPSDRLDVPEMEFASPAAGKRVRYQMPSDKGRGLYAALYLPPDWKPGKAISCHCGIPGKHLLSRGWLLVHGPA